MEKKAIRILFILVMCYFLNGCMLLEAPFMLVNAIVGTAFNVVGGAFNLINKLPTPPPGVFF